MPFKDLPIIRLRGGTSNLAAYGNMFVVRSWWQQLQRPELTNHLIRILSSILILGFRRSVIFHQSQICRVRPIFCCIKLADQNSLGLLLSWTRARKPWTYLVKSSNGCTWLIKWSDLLKTNFCVSAKHQSFHKGPIKTLTIKITLKKHIKHIQKPKNNEKNMEKQ